MNNNGQRYALEMLEHKITPFIKKIKDDVANLPDTPLTLRIKQDIADLENKVTDLVIQELNRKRKGDGQ